MLFKIEHLQGIKSGAIALAFRKWNKLAAKEGSLMKTAVGIIEVLEVSRVELLEITEQEAQMAGFPNLNLLIDLLNKVTSGDIYRIRLSYKSEDPRLELRENTLLDKTEFDLLKAKVEKLDKFSKQGDWTLQILNAIKNNPKLRAADLALLTGKEKDWLKLNVRKLKNLGLTISFEPGYTLSPLGEHYLNNL